MFKEHEKMVRDIRENMRGGKGAVDMLHIFNQDEMQGKCRLFCKVTLNPGCSIGPHVHEDEEEIYYILSGNGIVMDHGVQKEIAAGQALKTGGGESHSIENTGSEPLVFIAAINLF